MKHDNKKSAVSSNSTHPITGPLQLLQGPGLNGLYQTAALLSWEYDEPSKKATYVLSKDYTLHIQNYPSKKPDISPLKPEHYKLLDILICKLAENNESRQVELPFGEYLHLAGYAATATNKDDIRPKLRNSVALLGALSADWTEENGRYVHKNVKFFDLIVFRNSRVYACFSDRMALYLRGGCSTMALPRQLLAISGKSPHSYVLGRRCLVHNAANKERLWQPIRVGSLLSVCPRLPRPKPGEKWSPSILDRKVITPFRSAMNALANSGILSWKFREPAYWSDYEEFSNSIVDFLVTQVSNPIFPPLPVESDDEFPYESAGQWLTEYVEEDNQKS